MSLTWQDIGRAFVEVARRRGEEIARNQCATCSGLGVTSFMVGTQHVHQPCLDCDSNGTHEVSK